MQKIKYTCFLTAEFLEKEGYIPVSYTDAEQAFEDIKEGRVHYDLLISDLSFKNRSKERLQYDGRDVVNISQIIHENIPIVCISGYDWAPEGCRRLEKPVFPPTLLKIVEECLEEKRGNKFK